MEQLSFPLTSRNSLSEQVRSRILDKIASGELSPGERLVEARIAGELQVSSIPVREAIRDLVARRILDYNVHKGVRVRRVSMAETVDALHVKGALEALAARLAGERLKELVPRLREFTNSIEDSARTRDFVAYQNHNQRFHGAVVEAAENALLLRLWDSLDFEVRTRFIMDYLQSVDPSELAREHEDILQAIEEGNSERAGACLNSHALHLVQHLQQQTAENREDSQVK